MKKNFIFTIDYVITSPKASVHPTIPPDALAISP